MSVSQMMNCQDSSLQGSSSAVNLKGQLTPVVVSEMGVSPLQVFSFLFMASLTWQRHQIEATCNSISPGRHKLCRPVG